METFDARDTVVYGVNPAGSESHRNYVEKKGFNFSLLSDAERSVAERYGALKENGKSIERTVYVIDKAGKVSFARRGMPSDDDILAAIHG
jgi:peroxiredoxin Q/BCP